MNIEIRVAGLARGDKEKIEALVQSDFQGHEFLVCDDKHADEACKEQILDSLWAFKASFIADHARHKLTPAAVKAIEKMQGDLAEDANEIVRALIRDEEAFVKHAIEADGRGHFLNPYDGEEQEFTFKRKTLFVYRLN